MALLVAMDTVIGKGREIYLRINTVRAVSNHRVEAPALLRGFASREAFLGGQPYVWEREIDVSPIDVSLPLWPQVYANLKALEEFADATDC